MDKRTGVKAPKPASKPKVEQDDQAARNKGGKPKTGGKKH